MRIVVGMSGGVDSSLSAALLKEQGHDVVGITMRLWTGFGTDPARAGAGCVHSDARRVATAAGFPHYELDLEEVFRREVVADFVAAYAAGRTPNPCVRCNERIKFGRLWEHARRLGAEAVATGHYARIEAVAGRLCPRVAADHVKDQTYFLFSLTQEQLAAARFPVGGLTKPQVRSESRRRGLATADKRESQDICFVGKGGLDGFLRQAVPEAFVPGPVVLEDGTVLGEHAGLAAYTIGQRKGLGVAWREPLFVVRLDLLSRTVVLGRRVALLVSELPLRDCTWHLAAPPIAGLECLVRPRYRTPPVPATIVPAEGVGPEGRPNAVVRFHSPQPRPSPGQACVAYDLAGELCLGGGWFV